MSEPTIASQVEVRHVEAIVGESPSAEAPQQKPDKADKPRSLWSDAWYDLRRRPLFIVASALIALVLLMVLVPQLFTSADPYYADLARSKQLPSANAWFGYDVQGHDMFSRTIYASRASVIVGLLATLFTVLVGGAAGMISGFYGGLLDAVMSRIADVFFGLPFILGGIIILTTFRSDSPTLAEAMLVLVGTIAMLSWPVAMRITRSAAITVKQQDYVKAARALGASDGRIIVRHMLPNCLAPMMVYATIALGAFIGAEATLSYLGIGLPPGTISWGVMINDAKDYIRVAPHMLIFPAAFLTTTVLAFVMLGDVVRQALDPKLR
ncbi:ABC transporter permease [Pseudonocardiaceae bacterium YIM PH 21723]|nr:ABC transporter permease [Pseudonocardiaceae bacterium YIM PH 21723]